MTGTTFSGSGELLDAEPLDRDATVALAALDKLGARGISEEEAEQVLNNAFVIEQTLEPTSWLIITGWTASDQERRILSRG